MIFLVYWYMCRYVSNIKIKNDALVMVIHKCLTVEVFMILSAIKHENSKIENAVIWIIKNIKIW